MGGDGQVNYVHEEALWKQRLETEMKGAHEWFDNWGFLANKPLGDPRGFSSSVAKYTYGATAHIPNEGARNHTCEHAPLRIVHTKAACTQWRSHTLTVWLSRSALQAAASGR